MSMVMNRQELGQSDTIRRPTVSAVRASPLPSSTDISQKTTSAQQTMSSHNLHGLAGSGLAPAERNSSSIDIFDQRGIWGHGSGLGRGFHADRRTNGQTNNTAKTGSGLLLDDSYSDGWSRGSASNNSKLISGVVRSEVTSAPSSRPQVDASLENPAPMPNGTSAASSGLSARPAAINLNGANGHQSRPSFGANFTNPSTYAPYEQPPPVYTKSNRPPVPSYHTQAHDGAQRFDPTIRQHGSAQPSPSEERQSWISSGSMLSHQSMPGSRNSSLPPSRDGDDQHLATVPTARLGQDQFRRQSTPHANVLMANASNPMNRAALQFGQMSINDTRSGPPSQINGDFGGHGYDLPMSEASNFGQYSRRGSRQIETPTSSSFMNGMHTEGLSGGSFGMDMYAQQSGQRSRLDGAVGGNSRPVSFSGPRDSRRDSAQSRDFQLSGGHGTTWGMDHRLRALQELQAFNDPRFAQAIYQSLRQTGPPYMMSPPGAPHGNSASPYYQQMNAHVPQGRDHHDGGAYRSPVLDEYKSAGRSSKKFELRDAFGHVVEFSGDQHGSRFIQSKLETASSEEKSIVFKEIMSNSVQLMTDIFGNYVIQKLFEHGDQYQKRDLARQMKGRVLALSVQMYGCRVVQKALEHVLTDQQAAIVCELKSDVMRCVKDQNGNHVIQKAIERCPADAIRFIFDAFLGNILQLSVHAYGCRVIQRCLEFCEQTDKDTIMAELHVGMPNLVIDQYGNYVVQHVVEHGKDSDRKVVLAIVSANLEAFSKHKFASNVVETCLTHGGSDFQKLVLERFIAGNKRPQESLILGLIKDSFGNYVVQKMLDVLPQREYSMFMEHLQPEIQKARRGGSGKQVASIEKKMHRFPWGGQQMHHQPRSNHHSRAVSAERTPALTFTSVQSSAISSINGDAIEGANMSRKGSIHGQNS